MAEINVERKSPSPWIWVLPLIAIVALVWFWAAAGGDDDEVSREVAGGVTPGAAVGTGGGEGAVEQYVAFAAPQDGAGAPQVGRDHAYTAEGLRKLGAALGSVTEREGDSDSRQAFERFREVADRIQQDPLAASHADQVREAFTRAATVIDSFERGPQQDLRAIAESIEPNRPLLEQQERVQRFFRESAQAIQNAGRS